MIQAISTQKIKWACKSLFVTILAFILVSCEQHTRKEKYIFIETVVPTSTLVIPTDPPPLTSTTPTISTPAAQELSTPIAPLDFTWSWMNVKCSKGEIIEATIVLAITGGLEPYTIIPKARFKVTDNKPFFVTVKSDTPSGEPSQKKTVSLPPDSEHCKQYSSDTPKPPPTDPPPQKEICGNGIDDDDDGKVDSADPDCPPDPPFKRQCDDGKDNDADGLIDLADPQCHNKNDDNESQ